MRPPRRRFGLTPAPSSRLSAAFGWKVSAATRPRLEMGGAGFPVDLLDEGGPGEWRRLSGSAQVRSAYPSALMAGRTT
jgi:hypothetical protein